MGTNVKYSDLTSEESHSMNSCKNPMLTGPDESVIFYPFGHEPSEAKSIT